MTDRPETERLPVPAGPARRRWAAAGGGSDAAFNAQVQGQDGQRRGLRGGRPVLDAARESYLRAEWTGPHDRRLPPGAVKRTTA